jgi:predicted O-methyltransferase YrrM
MLEHAKNCRGQITPKEVERLAWLASQVPENGLIVEIGAYRGKSGASLATGMPKSARLMSIDPWLLLNDTPQEYESINTVKEYSDNLKFAKPRVIQVIGYPLEVIHFLKDQKIDLLFIDAIKNGVTPIWEAYLPLVKQGGWIASHDYLPDPAHPQFYPDVVKVVDETVKPMTDEHHHIDFTFSGKKK